jgi:hypothetical protein
MQNPFDQFSIITGARSRLTGKVSCPSPRCQELSFTELFTWRDV